MLNFAINRKESKNFVCYYKETEDGIVVKYGDRANVVYKNTPSNKTILNEIMEEQVLNGELYFTDESSRFRIDSRKHLGRVFFIYSIFSASVGALTIPIADFFELNNIVGTYTFAISGGFLILPIKNIIKALDLSKNRMFLENKDIINQYLYDHDGTSLSINDVHNLSIGKMAITCFSAKNHHNRIALKKRKEKVENGLDKRLVK